MNIQRRKVRADKGEVRSSRKTPARCTQHDGIIDIALCGAHGTGNSLRLSNEDSAFILKASDDGRSLYVVPFGPRHTPKVIISGVFAQVFAGSGNPKHNISVARALLGEMLIGHTVRFLDGDPFNLCRDNLALELRATKQQFPIDWQKAEARRTELSEPAFAALTEKHARIGRAVR